MADLKTTYMGKELKTPIIVGSSELSDTPEKVKKLAEYGAGAVVLKSLFEEQIMMEVDAQRVNNIYGSYEDVENYVSFYTRKHNLDEYLNLVEKSKKETDIPIFASINCVSNGEWVEFARQIEKAGADGIELNMFIMPNDHEKRGSELEQVYFDVIEHINKEVSIPVSMKVSSYFSGMAHMLTDLSKTDLSALVLFNHFYKPDVDIEKEQIISAEIFTSPKDIANTLRWVGIMSDKVECDIAASTGIHSGDDVIKALLVGANAVEIASVLYKYKSSYLKTMIDDIERWMNKKGYASIADFRGKMNQANVKRPMMFERAQFMKYYSNNSTL
ncbi:MAG: diguanylate cyclase [Salinivirgaceae bacterium]|nr:MAG: diguanylate cyclase [Salinivirgaceae bacterium]